MAAQQLFAGGDVAEKVDLTLNENNDEEILATLVTNQPAPDTALNLTGKTLEAFLKASAATSDADGSTWKGTSGGGQITVTNAANGAITVAVPASAITTSMKWWRVDVLSGALRKTALYGDVTVTDL
jgi:hypothetical protein